MGTTDPIFIHSLFHCAGSYFLQKFRRLGAAVTCYQEPFSESLTLLNEPGRWHELLAADAQRGRNARSAQRSLREFWSIREQLQGLFRASFAFQDFFLHVAGRLPAEQLSYLSALTRHAAGRPVLQFYRSFGRIQALHREYEGVHLHLWREPRVQWWAYKAHYYFDEATQRIYHADHLPEALRRIAALAGISGAPVRHLPPRENYLTFYGLWLDSWLRLRSHAALSISLDDISVSRKQNMEVSLQLFELTGCALDLFDARARGMAFASDEEPFYAEVEQAVHDIFIETGRGTAVSVQAASAAALGARRAQERCQRHLSTERNLRETALRMMQQVAGQERSARGAGPGTLIARLGKRWRSLRGLGPGGAPGADASAAAEPGVDSSVAALPGRLR